MASRRRIARWCREAESLTLANDPPISAGLKRNFRALPPRAQAALAHEIVETRSRELSLAYRNVVALAVGHKRRRRKPGGFSMSTGVGVTFIVRQKWDRGSVEDERARLPAFLVAYTTHDGERLACAVPTDVEPAERYADFSPAASSAREIIDVGQPSTGAGTAGALTCALERPAHPGQTFGLGCRHVLSLSLEAQSTLSGNLPVRVRHVEGPLVGRTTRVRGSLRTSERGRSLDAQLLHVDDEAALSAVLEGIRFDGPEAFAKHFSDIPERYFVLVPRPAEAHGARTGAVAIPLRKHLVHRNFGLPYGGRIGGMVVHQWVVESLTERTERAELGPFPGDSGSPVVTGRTGGTLLGMHFGGRDSGGKSYMIPAWQLFEPANFHRQREARWRLVP